MQPLRRKPDSPLIFVKWVLCLSPRAWRSGNRGQPSSLSDLKNRSEIWAERGQILSVWQVNSVSIDKKSGEIWTAQADLQPISFKSDRLLGLIKVRTMEPGWDTLHESPPSP